MTKFDIRKSMLLYAVTDSARLGERTLTEVCEDVLRNGATFLQLREKALHGEELLPLARELKALCGRYSVPFVVDDDVEAALACGADGVHVGQSDIRGRDIRAIIGPDKILGISANTVEAAVAAQAAGADYIGVGAVFGTATKQNASNITVEQLRVICDAVDIPVVAIGGISETNLPQLADSGIDGVAVVSAIFGQTDPGTATARLLTLVKEVVNHG